MELDILCITNDVYSLPLHEQALKCFPDKKCAVTFGLGELGVTADKPFTPPKLMLVEAEYIGTLQTLAGTLPKAFGWVRDTPLIVLQVQFYSSASNVAGFNVMHTVSRGDSTNTDTIRACIDIFDLASKTTNGVIVQAADYANAQAKYAELNSARSAVRAAQRDLFPKKL